MDVIAHLTTSARVVEAGSLSAAARGLGLSEIAERSPEDVRGHTFEIWLTAEDLPSDENRAHVDAACIQLSYRRTNLGAYERLRAAMVAVLSRIDPGGVPLGYQLGVSGVSHQHGTLRFRADPLRTRMRSRSAGSISPPRPSPTHALASARSTRSSISPAAPITCGCRACPSSRPAPRTGTSC